MKVYLCTFCCNVFIVESQICPHCQKGKNFNVITEDNIDMFTEKIQTKIKEIQKYNK